MPLNLNGKISKEKAVKILSGIFIGLTIFLGIFYFVLFLGVGGYWVSPWSWFSGVIITTIFMYQSRNLVSKPLFKRLVGFILLCGLLTMPVYLVSNVTSGQSTAKSLSSQKEINYFKNLLGRSYNYTELIVWENQHLKFYSKSDLIRNTDSIKIVNYGKGMCGEFATLYAELCISQGYRCRIVSLVFNDHDFNEVQLTNGSWIRVDASLNDTSPRAIGYPQFFEKEPTWTPPILALAYENSSIVDVTSTYNSHKIPAIVWAFVFFLYLFCFYAIMKYLMQPKFGKSSAKKENLPQFCFFVRS